VDVYGTDEKNANLILRKYAQEIIAIETHMMDAFKSIQNGGKENQVDALFNTKQQLKEKIKQENKLAFVDFQTVLYPGDPDLHTTVEVIQANRPDRLRFITPPIHAKHYAKKQDLINQMLLFTDIGVGLMVNNEIDVEKISCPVYHCVTGFDHPKLKPYLNVFNKGAIKQKQLILKTLKQDSNPERRGAAAYLVGHFKNPEEIISTLTPYVNDPDNGVRNNVVRVIAMTMAISKLSQINVSPFIDLLDSPYTTDRNKSLYVLQAAANSEKGKVAILKQGGDKLLALLALKQPNNHDPAYEILKKISGQHFQGNDLKAWSNWVHTKQKQTV